MSNTPVPAALLYPPADELASIRKPEDQLRYIDNWRRMMAEQAAISQKPIEPTRKPCQ